MTDAHAEAPILPKRTRQEVLAEIRANFEKQHMYANQLLSNIKENQSRLENALTHIKKFEAYVVYYFYHQSWDVFTAKTTLELNKALLESLSPDNKPLNSWFLFIYDTAMQKEFNDSTNANWRTETQPILEAFLAREILY